MRGRRGTFVLVGGLLAVVAGCGGEKPVSAPVVTPLPVTVQASPTPTATPSVAVSSSPPARRFQVTAGPPPKTPMTRRGAEHFVRAYYATANEAVRSGSVDDLLWYTTENCPCRQLVKMILASAAKHERNRGTEWRLLRVKATLVDDAAAVVVDWHGGGVVTKNASGEFVDKSQVYTRTSDVVSAGYSRGRWVIFDIRPNGAQQ